MGSELKVGQCDLKVWLLFVPLENEDGDQAGFILVRLEFGQYSYGFNFRRPRLIFTVQPQW